MTEKIERQLNYEFNLIRQKGFLSYFLIEWDFVNYARSHGIRCSARGSAAGSLLAYTLGITNVDPLRYQLPFERFFNPERADMPDIDMDFPDDRREEVIEYVSRKYGYECVAQMVTFNTMAAKGSVKDVSRVMNLSGLGERISRLIPTGPKVTLGGSLDTVKELGILYKENGEAREIIDEALKLEGTVRSTGVHAAGVVISGSPIDSFVPLQYRDPRDRGKGRITQYEQKYLEELGLIKFDFLGLSNLTILQKALSFIEEFRGEKILLEQIPLDPVWGDEHQNKKRQKAFDLLSAGKTVAIFQLEGAKMREYIKQLRPTCIEDIMAMIALYRPGPMESIPDFIEAKHGRKKVTYLDPRLSEWLAESYGVIVYQDQVLQIAVGLASFTWGKVNKFRKALSKKIMHEVEGYKGDFIAGCVKNNMKQETAEQLFTLLLPFGGYGFNKAHAASYAVVAFYTAYLKANYPEEYMAAALSVMANNTTKVALFLAECKRIGVPVKGPDVNKSDRSFRVEDGAVRFGLLAIKNIGDGPIHAILQAREEGGHFRDLGDFCSRVNQKTVGKDVITNLIKAGAMDSLGVRHLLLHSVDRALRWGKSQQLLAGQSSLFHGHPDDMFVFQLASNAPEIPLTELLASEKELLGTYLSTHPLEYVARLFEGKVTHSTADLAGEETLDEDADGEEETKTVASRLAKGKEIVTLGGVIQEVKPITTKKGDTMCVAVLEDLEGTIGVTVFPKVFATSHQIWQSGEMVLVSGEVQSRQDGENVVLCTKVVHLTTASQEVNRKRYHLSLTLHSSGECDPNTRTVSDNLLQVQDLYDLLKKHPGLDSYDITISNKEWSVWLLPRVPTSICYSPELHDHLLNLLGQDGVKVHTSSSMALDVSG